MLSSKQLRNRRYIQKTFLLSLLTASDETVSTIELGGGGGTLKSWSTKTRQRRKRLSLISISEPRKQGSWSGRKRTTSSSLPFGFGEREQALLQYKLAQTWTGLPGCSCDGCIAARDKNLIRLYGYIVDDD